MSPYNVAKLLGDAVDRVRRSEQREQLAEGNRSLVGTKYTWLKNPERLGRDSGLDLSPANHSRS